MTIVISTVEEALLFLSEYENAAPEDTPEIAFGGELATLDISIHGARYTGTVPGELARGLWEYQEAIYKAAAFALYGVDHIGKLSAEQRANFELIFKVSEGSTDLVALLENLYDALKEGFLTMESKHKQRVLIAIALFTAGGLAATAIVESNNQAKVEEFKAKTVIEQEQEKTKQFEIIAGLARSNQVVQNFAKANEDGARAVARRAPDATSIDIGRTRVTRDDIIEVNKRSSYERTTVELVQEDFWVFGTYSRDQAVTKFTLARRDGTEVNVLVSADDFPPEDLEKIWTAARNRKPITLAVNLTMHRGKVSSSAQIAKVP